MFAGLINVMCSYIDFFLGPWAWLIGVMAIAVGAGSLFFEEGKVFKWIGGICIAVGIIVAAPNVMNKFVPSAANTCSQGKGPLING